MTDIVLQSELIIIICDALIKNELTEIGYMKNA